MRASQRAAHGAALLLVLIRGVFLGLVSAGAVAACPTSADLSAGIQFTFDDGHWAVVEALEEGSPRLKTTFGSTGDGYLREEAEYGLFSYFSQNLADGKVARPTLATALEILLVPHPGPPQLAMQVEYRTEILGMRMSGPSARTVVEIDDIPSRVRIAGCDYEVWLVRQNIEDGSESSLRTSLWFPGLGLGLAVREEVSGVLIFERAVVGIQ